jgi:acetoin utilization deacetylase AcuC-like enzyme
MDEITLVHKPDHVRKVEAMAKDGGGHMDADTPVSRDSYEVALQAVGGALNAVDAVIGGEVANVLCLVRPPGHHATPTRAMGFCLFNNVAIAAKYAQRKHGVKRVLIVDWDVHHGNGTQDTFYSDGSVMYFSTHRYPFYPGTGRREENGEGAGKGCIVNVPLPFNTRAETLVQAFHEVIHNQATAFKPELIVVSAGFDAYRRDPIGGLGLEPEHFRTLTEIVMTLASGSAKGRIVSCLEGGYGLSALPLCVEQHLRPMAGM